MRSILSRCDRSGRFCGAAREPSRARGLTPGLTRDICGVAIGVALALAAVLPAFGQTSWREPVQGEEIAPPPITREFRGVWVASVANIDWPSSRTLTTAQQQAEAVRMLDAAQELNLNAVLLQVRPSCDALYASELEPWSEFLTGASGTPPAPAYDPLEFWINEAHKRGIELHAWFNPFRARHFEAKGPDAETHISKSRPELVRSYDNYLWLDPGEPDARAHSLKVMLDVARRYDVDGIHLDDYFYPYPKTVNGKEVPFPDDGPFDRSVREGSTLPRGDWRRENINGFMRELYAGVHGVKPQVRVTISPFGIWRPGFPSMVKGFDAYDKLAADAKRWLNEGWLDACLPQLYWKVEAPQQPYGPLLAWWREQNTSGRHVYAGLNASNVGSGTKAWEATEISRQITIARTTADEKNPSGTAMFSMKSLANAALAAELKQVFVDPALTPAMTWLASQDKIDPPSVSVERNSSGQTSVSWTLANPAAVRWVVLSQRVAGVWCSRIVPAAQGFAAIEAGPAQPSTVQTPSPAEPAKTPEPSTPTDAAQTAPLVDAVVIRAIDRAGRESEPVVRVRDTTPPEQQKPER